MRAVITISESTEELIDELRKHQLARPDAPDDYLANITHLQLQMDRWQAHHNALSIVIMERLLQEAMQ